MGTLDINAIQDYLLKVGCKIEYPILVNAFKQHLYNPDPNVQGKIRTQFKDYVNRLAIVSLENNMKFIILRPEFRPPSFQELHSMSPNCNPNPITTTMTPHDTTTPSREPPLAKVQHRHQSQQASSPFTTPRTTQPQRSNVVVAPNQQQQQQQIILSPPLPPPVPQHHKDHPGAHRQHPNQQQQYQTSQPQSSLSHQSSVLSPSIVHQRQVGTIQLAPQKQTKEHQQQQQTIPKTPKQLHQIQRQLSLSVGDKPYDVQDSSMAASISMPPPPPPPPLATKRQHMSLNRPESLNLGGSVGSINQMPPPRPPPRRRQSTASLFKQSPKPVEKIREIHDLAKKSLGRVKEHALKLNSFTHSASSSDLNSSMPTRNCNMKENRLSRDSSISGSLSSALQRNGSHLTTRSRSSHREDESDSSSLQPIDPLRRKWAIEACNCNYNGLLTLLREDPKLAGYKDIVNGYTALHWAAKFGNLDIIKLIAGTHGVSANIKSSAGYTPLHIANMFDRNEAANLLLKSYKANPDIRDHSGKRPMQYCKSQSVFSK